MDAVADKPLSLLNTMITPKTVDHPERGRSIAAAAGPTIPEPGWTW